MGGFNFSLLFIAVVIVVVTILFLPNLPIWASFLVGLIAVVVVIFLIDLIAALVEKRPPLLSFPHPFYKSFPKAPKGLTCPECASKDIAVILYGLPALSGKLEKAIAEGQVTLGGCLVYDGAPEWVCNACGNKFGELRQQNLPPNP
jgi:DNA-directed RNA polymerase subunit RPC12/RpoP